MSKQRPRNDKCITGMTKTAENKSGDGGYIRMTPNKLKQIIYTAENKKPSMRMRPEQGNDTKLYIAEQSAIINQYLDHFPEWRHLKNGEVVLRRASESYKRMTAEKVKTMILAGVTEPIEEQMEAFLASRKTESNRMCYYYAAQTWAAARGMPSLRKRTFKITKHKPKIYTEQHVRAMLNVDLGPWTIRDRCIIAVAAGGGLRRKELKWLKVSDVRADLAMVEVKDYGQGIKSFQERGVPIPEPYRSYIAAWLNTRAEMVRRYNIVDPGWLFLTERGGQMHDITIYGVMAEAAKKCGLKPGETINAVAHSFRRYALSAYGKNGTSLGLAQEIAGHSSPLITRAYQQFNEEDKLAAASKRGW